MPGEDLLCSSRDQYKPAHSQDVHRGCNPFWPASSLWHFPQNRSRLYRKKESRRLYRTTHHNGSEDDDRVYPCAAEEHQALYKAGRHLSYQTVRQEYRPMQFCHTMTRQSEVPRKERKNAPERECKP